MPQLPASASPPRVQMPIIKHSNCMRFPTSNLPHFLLFEYCDEFRFGLIRAAIFIFRHGWSVRMAELAAATTTPGVESAILREGYCVCISTSDLGYFHID